MTKLPWQHNRSRTRSGGNKTENTSSQEWFSRTGGEPSRQALTDLLKEHKREKSSGSSGSRTHSRTNTISSLEWNGNQIKSDAGSELQSSRSISPVETREGSLSSTMDRHDSSTKTLLAKGSQLLRRKGSKMSLSSAASSSNLNSMASARSTYNQTSPTGASHVQAGDLRKAISAPFNFQHVTHTEQNQFSGLGRIEESELTQRFTAATTGRSASYLQGISAETIGVAHGTPESDVATASNTVQDYNATQLLPTTPPRPSPPPKDIVVAPIQNLELGSSRPSPRSPGFPQAQLDIDASNAVESQGDALNASKLSLNLDAKPLPQLPTVIHAVSTTDDTARTMIAAPLPSPPGLPRTSSPFTAPTKTHHRPQKSSVTLRTSALSPSSKASMPNLLTHGSLSTPLTTLPRHRSDMALSEQARDGTDLDSFSQMHLESTDWEAAIDEAWDSVDMSTHQADIPDERISYSYGGSDMSLHPSSQSDDGGISTGSTPLMMAAFRPDASSEPSGLPADVNKEGTRLSVVPEQRVLTGLGISHTHGSPPISAPGRASAIPSFHLATKRSTATVGSFGTLSRSSSQESMLMSHASSVIGTQRSSNSSVGDYESIAPSERGFSTKLSSQSSLLAVSPSQAMSMTSKQAARPESGCLPPDIVQQLAAISTAATSQDESNIRSYSEDNADSYQQGLVVPESPVTDKNASSVFPGSPRSPRRRSNASGIRPRTSSRVSYSLFPMPTVPSATQPTIVNS